MRCTVEKLGFKGDGSVIIDGKEYFVPYVLEGEEVEVEIADPEKDRAILKSIITPSDKRKEPVCKLFGVCGACKLQHLKDYHDFKEGFLKKTLKPLNIADEIISPINFITGANRRRALFNVVDGKIGFFKEKSNDIVEVKYCPLLVDAINNLIKNITLPKITASITVSAVENGLDIDIVSKKAIDSIYEKPLMNAFRSGVRLSVNGKTLFERERPYVKFADTFVNFPNGSFLQPSVKGEKSLLSSVLSMIKRDKFVADIFCGMGTFTVPLSKISKEVYGYEAFDLGVRTLNYLKIPNLRAFERDLFKLPLKGKELNKFNVAVIDPPRTGAVEQAKAFKDAKNLEQIIYVSCNPSTFVRDAKYILDAGFKINKIDVTDQFIYTHHLEIVVNFIKE